MERVGTLIQKLQEQFNEAAGKDALLVTTQLLLAEIHRLPAPQTAAKVAVVIPAARVEAPSVQPTTTPLPAATVANETNASEATPVDVQDYKLVKPSIITTVEEVPVIPVVENATPVEEATVPSVPAAVIPTPSAAAEKPITVVVDEPAIPVFAAEKSVHDAFAETTNETISAQDTVAPIAPEPTQPVLNKWLYETEEAAPTLSQHKETTENESKEVFELNDMMASETPDLNSKLKQPQVEVAAMLQSTPVKDLKKAIGINDRYLFINELFRGDEDMYERSLKTINSFRILPEAEYWIQRELIIKLGWNEQSETVKSFGHLVKRRFS